MRHLFAALACCLAMTALHAEPFDFQRDCAQWSEQKGYSTDYIKLQVGKRQRGSAEAWRGNVEPKDVQPGDIVMSYIREKGIVRVWRPSLPLPAAAID